MNLNESPTEKQLAELFASVDDDAAHHTLWVGVDGGVHIDRFESFVRFELPDVKFRTETFDRGNGYVGKEAAKDPVYVAKELRWLLGHWKAGSTGYLDYPPPA
jgi:hypothetical protein